MRPLHPADPGLMDPRGDVVYLEVGHRVLRLRRRMLYALVLAFGAGAFLLGALTGLGALAALPH